MELVKIEVEVSKAADLFFGKLENFALAMDKALEDGWELGQDLPVVLTAALGELVPAMQAFAAMTQDFKDAPMIAAKAGLIHTMNIVSAFMTKAA